MKNYYDEFSKLPVAKMAQKITDMTFGYKETIVPVKHYKDMLSKSYEEVVEDSISINLIDVYFKTMKTLLDENPKWFYQALLCIDTGTKPSTIKSQEYQALELTYAKYSERNEHYHVNFDYVSLFNGIKENGSDYLLDNDDSELFLDLSH